MQHLEVSGAVRHIYIWVVRRQTVATETHIHLGVGAQTSVILSGFDTTWTCLQFGISLVSIQRFQGSHMRTIRQSWRIHQVHLSSFSLLQKYFLQVVGVVMIYTTQNYHDCICTVHVVRSLNFNTNTCTTLTSQVKIY